jgi:hypothetical protein
MAAQRAVASNKSKHSLGELVTLQTTFSSQLRLLDITYFCTYNKNGM